MDDAISGVLTPTLDRWLAAVNAHDSQLVSTHFTEDVLFQGLDPDHVIGRQGVAAYYAKLPAGVSASYGLVAEKQLGDAAVVGYVRADFTFADGRVNRLHITVVAESEGAEWAVNHFHVSKIGE
jgi:uncharacterized protein (TIGR02246 family)